MKIVGKRMYAKVEKIKQKLFLSYRQKKITNKDFSIICNNCWGGYVYRRYGLPYLSPTVGLYFFADDYIKFCYNLREYMKKELVFIQAEESKWFKELKEKNNTCVPIARLGDIEIIFLHYHSKEEAKEKWERRATRINYSNLIFKFSKMNECTDENLKQFDRFVCDKKICFIPRDEKVEIKSGIHFESATQGMITDDTSEYCRFIDIEKLINAKYVCGNKME